MAADWHGQVVLHHICLTTANINRHKAHSAACRRTTTSASHNRESDRSPLGILLSTYSKRLEMMSWLVWITVSKQKNIRIS